jgi:hypothetical protein
MFDPVVNDVFISRLITGVAAVLLAPVYLYAFGTAVVKEVRQRRAASAATSSPVTESEWAAVVGSLTVIAWILSLFVPAARDVAFAILVVALVGGFAYSLQVGIVRRASKVKSPWREVVVALPSVTAVVLLELASYASTFDPNRTERNFVGALMEQFIVFTGFFIIVALLTVVGIRIALGDWGRRNAEQAAS